MPTEQIVNLARIIAHASGGDYDVSVGMYPEDRENNWMLEAARDVRCEVLKEVADKIFYVAKSEQDMQPFHTWLAEEVMNDTH